MNKELQNYIKLSRESGMSNEQIKQELLESSSGWTKEDINQAFGTENSLENAQVSEPKISGKSNLPFQKYLLGFGIVVVLGLVGYGGYWYFSSTDTNKPISPITEEKIIDADKPVLPIPAEKENQIEDCGTTEFFVKHKDDLLQSLQSELIIEEANEDTALVCLGNNILDNCKKSEAIFKTTDMGDIKFIVEGGENDICNIRTEYGDAEQIQAEVQKQWANTYMSCPVDLNDLLREATEKGENINEAVGIFPIVVYFYLGFASFDPEQLNCTTDQTPVAPF